MQWNRGTSFPRLENALFSCDVHAEGRVVFDLHIEPKKYVRVYWEIDNRCTVKSTSAAELIDDRTYVLCRRIGRRASCAPSNVTDSHCQRRMHAVLHSLCMTHISKHRLAYWNEMRRHACGVPGYVNLPRADTATSSADLLLRASPRSDLCVCGPDILELRVT
jgi:hypothetical protein